MSHRIAKTNKSFTIGEELILPARTDICRVVLRKTRAEKRTQVPLSARIAARRVEDMAEDITAYCYVTMVCDSM